MTSHASVLYPVIVIDRDRWVLWVCDSYAVLSATLEPFDVLANEYDAWDASGARLKLLMSGDKTLKGPVGTLEAVRDMQRPAHDGLEGAVREVLARAGYSLSPKADEAAMAFAIRAQRALTP